MTTNNSSNVCCYSLCIIVLCSWVITGLSESTLPSLSAGVHHVIFHFIPNYLPEAHSTTREYQFEIEPTGYYILNSMFICIISRNIFILADANISVNEDTVTANLYANTEGIFTYSLDGTTFQKCM